MSHFLNNQLELEKKYSLKQYVVFPTHLSVLLAIVSGLLMAASQEINLSGAQWIAFVGIVP
ncbi:hypothetical protein KKB99_05675, partial [bacterium]|nr:hypothetical protein [bacterium]MBU1025481.1 hypothetical protein [bacterium]